MSESGKLLLKKMAAEYDETGNSDFDSVFLFGCSNALLDELENQGYIIQKHDIIGTVTLTKSGYQSANN